MLKMNKYSYEVYRRNSNGIRVRFGTYTVDANDWTSACEKANERISRYLNSECYFVVNVKRVAGEFENIDGEI